MSDFPDYEAVAAEHEQWIRWAQKLMDTEQLSQERIDRWMPYMVPYAELPDIVKESDRKEAHILLDAALDDEPLYRLVEDRVKCGEDCQSPHPQQRYVRVWPKKDNDEHNHAENEWYPDTCSACALTEEVNMRDEDE